jgi:hypothetical protein
MWLSDFEEAIQNVKAVLGDCCFMRIAWSFDGSALIFYPNSALEEDNIRFVYYRKSHKLLKQYADTWRHPDDYEVIYEGD